jgi:hypothetical protein
MRNFFRLARSRCWTRSPLLTILLNHAKNIHNMFYRTGLCFMNQRSKNNDSNSFVVCTVLNSTQYAYVVSC